MDMGLNIAADRGWILWVAYALIFVSVYVVARLIFQEEESRAAQENLATNKEKKLSNPLVRITHPIYAQYVVPFIRKKQFMIDRRERLRGKIISSGLENEFTPEEFMAFKLTLIFVFPVMGGLLKTMGLLDYDFITVLLVSAPVGWFFPDVWVNMRYQARRKQVVKSLPFVVDLLALTSETLELQGSMQKVVEKSASSPLIDELAKVLRDIRMGKLRKDALKDMAERLNVPEVNSFIAILISSTESGASISKILKQQSELIRNQRMLAAEKAGAAAAQKILFPLVFVIMPAVMIIIFAPYLIAFLTGGVSL